MSSSNPTTAVAAITAASPPNAYLNANSQSGSDPNGQSRSLKLSKKARSAIIRKSQKQQADPSDQPDEPPASGSPLLAKVPSNVFSDLSPNDSDDNVSEDSVDAPHASVPMGDSQGPEGGNPKAQSQNNNINNELTNTLSHQNETSRYDSLAQFSFGSDTVKIRESEPLPPFTGENTLVDRHISVAVVNLVGFHQYVAATPSNRVAKDHECMVSYIHEAAKKCGGVLDTFSGDKFWVSFNATTDCDESPIAAALFACEVASTINREASVYHRQLEQTLLATQITGRPPLAKPSIKFGAALRGATIGVSTGRGKVGTLGNSKVRRHAILSSVVSEAAALERMAGRYPDCGVMVGGDMIPAIEGYFQYLLLDATALPGSGGLRRRIASVKGNMLAPHRHHIPFLLGTALKLANPLPSANPFDAINDCFNAFLEGRTQAVAQKLSLISTQVVLSRQAHEAKATSSTLPDGTALLSPLHRRAAI
eukprot:GDKK01071013.1.p1 GENE.GDKK01071013.1~~GDKK01071013.1.p1  ORF type:complete len:518 (-),score=27.92 GDKK01071013.1:235-1674(-)